MADDQPAGDGAAAENDSKPPVATTSTSMANIDSQAIATNRKAYLLSLVPDLTLDEIWMLQERLAKLDLRTDIFARLPPELRIMVADCLGPSDLGCCLHVSCMWRGSFLHESLRKDLARRCFPSLLEYVDAVRLEMAKKDKRDKKEDADGTTEKGKGRETDESSASTEDQINKAHNAHIDLIFAETARKYALRALGRFRYVFRHCRNPPFAVAEKAAEKIAGKPTSDVTASETTWLDQGRPLTRRKNKRRMGHQELEQRYGQQYPGASQYGWQPPRPHDLFQNRMDPTLEPDSDEDEEEEADVLSFHGTEYAYGRLAWQCLRDDENDTWFLVDDLRDGRRLPLCVPNDHRRGGSFLLVGFGDEILMAASGNRM